jgi:hypothetical protein
VQELVVVGGLLIRPMVASLSLLMSLAMKGDGAAHKVEHHSAGKFRSVLEFVPHKKIVGATEGLQKRSTNFAISVDRPGNWCAAGSSIPYFFRC